MSISLRTTLLALGLGAIACSGETPTGMDPAASVVPLGAPASSFTCEYWPSATEFGPYIAQVSWSRMSVKSLYFTKDGTTQTYTNILNRADRSQNRSILEFPFAPTDVQALNRKGTVVGEAVCGETSPP